MKKKIISLLLVLALAFTACGMYGSLGISEASAVTSSTYLIKVNKQRNVVTVYKKANGKYKPYRAMLCATGGSKTPSGTFYLNEKYRWHELMGPCWGQYTYRFYGSYLFHSVPYYQNGNKATCYGEDYNKLGTSCSHGCVRLAVIDVKWIYENCPAGTKVVIYKSQKAGPLGKPKGLKVRGKKVWDPTDPDPKNPDFRLKKPVISIYGIKGKTVKKTVSYSAGKVFRLKANVKARNVNALQDLTGNVKIYRLYKWSDGKWKSIKKVTSIKRSRSGKYKIKYRVYDKYCGGASYACLKLTINKKPAPEPPEPSPEPEPVPEEPDEPEITDQPEEII